MSYKNVYVWLKPQFLGDAVMATPLLDALSAACENIVVRANPAVQQVLADRAGKLLFATGDKISGFSAILQSVRELKALKPEMVILVNRSFRSALAAKLAGIPIRVGHDTERRGRLLTHAVEYSLGLYEASCYLELAQAVGIQVGDSKPSLGVTEPEKFRGNELIRGATIGFQPGARYPEKQVPITTLSQVARKMHELGHKLAILGGSDEREAAIEFMTLFDFEVVNLVGQCSIRESLGALSKLKLMIGSDTGLMHLAVGAGCPTVTVFGPNPASKWGHRYAPHQVIEAPEAKPALVDAETLISAAERAMR